MAEPTKREIQEYIDRQLADRVDRAKEVYEKGNLLGAAYLATIAGMWTNCYKRPNNNPYANDATFLYRWFANGYEDFTKAIGMNIDLRKKMLEKERVEDEARGKPKTNDALIHPALAKLEEKKSFWKLW